MKMFKNLYLGISEDENLGVYTPLNRKFKRLPYYKFIKKLKNQINKKPEDYTKKPYNKYAYITGRVKEYPINHYLDKYLLLLDVDSIEAKDKVIAWLDNHNIRHFLINSSPGHFWIIGDKIDTVYNHTSLMSTIEGVLTV